MTAVTMDTAAADMVDSATDAVEATITDVDMTTDAATTEAADSATTAIAADTAMAMADMAMDAEATTTARA
jgi:hypothetical protein